MNKTFSFIIPVYNGAGVIECALDSIYSQGLQLEDFEVICVDDCSSTEETFNTLINYKYNGVHPSNLIVLRHTVNKRQGGARNTGLKHAQGKWVL
jgi:glycosyltransferase involved in cell wall biosynthesis